MSNYSRGNFLFIILMAVLLYQASANSEETKFNCRDSRATVKYSLLSQCVQQHDVSILTEFSTEDENKLDSSQKNILLDLICLNIINLQFDSTYRELQNDLLILQALVKNKLITFNLGQDQIYFFFLGDVFIMLGIIAIFLAYRTGRIYHLAILALPLIAFKISYPIFISLTLGSLKFLGVMFFFIFISRKNFKINFKNFKFFNHYTFWKTYALLFPITAVFLISLNFKNILKFDYFYYVFLPNQCLLSILSTFFIQAKFGIFKDNEHIRINAFGYKSISLKKNEIENMTKDGSTLVITSKDGVTRRFKLFFVKNNF